MRRLWQSIPNAAPLPSQDLDECDFRVYRDPRVEARQNPIT